MVEMISTEKEILKMADHPFLVGMKFVFQNDQRIYFVMPFVRGGELYRHQKAQPMERFSEDTARFYAIQVALALGHLHKKNIMYRDLKPENILMNEDGYICVADFGLAKVLNPGELARTFAGTSEYLAPEIVTEKGYSFPVDWWTLGILTYEMCVGMTPFFNANGDPAKIYKAIEHGTV